MGERIFYRYMSRTELDAVQRTGFLRRGRAGRAYWMEDRYESATEARAFLALRYTPEVWLEFRITNEPAVKLRGSPVGHAECEPGGGTE